MLPFRPHSLRQLAMLLLVLAGAPQSFAKETDQFTTPRRPLRDVGPALSRKVVRIIESDRTGDDPERILSRWVGHNFLESRLTRWVKAIRVADGPVSFRPSVFGSIYRRTFSPVPASFLVDSPTIRVHGYYLGTDKIDHFFQQGHHYYELITKEEAHGGDIAVAVAAAVALGVRQEHKYYGTLASGVYSNADLAANFAGMKFYLNLRRPVNIGGQVLPPMFERTPDGWRLRPGLDPDRLLEPFFSNHLDESFNPSRYRFSRGSIRSRVRNRCGQWTSFYADRLNLVAPSGRSFAATWFGEDYGHWLPPSQEVSIATECKGMTLEILSATPAAQAEIVR
jgi:hypothetical protein